MPDRIILVGPSGSGKSAVARLLAATLAYACIDTDARIVERIAMPIGAFFARYGEPAFRAIEEEVVADACRQRRVVVATGGGAVLSQRNWAAWRTGSVVIGLTASPETLIARVRHQAARDGDLAERPLLAGDASARMQAMLASRQPYYAIADVTIDTDTRTLGDVVSLAADAARTAADRGMVPTLSLASADVRSDIFVRSGGRTALPGIMRQRWPNARRVWVITDEHVAPEWLDETSGLLRTYDFDVRSLVVVPGEASKSLHVVNRLCDEMTVGGVTRRDIVVALGGGVVGDLAGFVASVCLRGLPLVQLPTSLLSMVDSSVGGKTGVNTPAGKNLVGSFYQPGVVMIDPDLLATLPRDEYRSGMAEIVKHALIQRSTPLGGADLREALETLQLDPLPADEHECVLTRNVAIKHSVVQADERESGLRMVLNFGHTVGHAIEAEGYRYRHGQAVAIGMLVAARIALRLGRVDVTYVNRVSALLERARLPVTMEGRVSDILARIHRDKKNVDGALHWILPERNGLVEPVTGVPVEIVRQALIESGAA